MKDAWGSVGGVLRHFLILFLFISSYAFGAPSLHLQMDREFEFPESGFTPEIRADLSKMHYVFIDGIMNELAKYAGNYYTDNLREMKRLGLSTTHFGLSSRTAILGNGGELASHIYDIHSKKKKPIVVFGHSMGGANLLVALTRYPFLLDEGIIDHAYVLQAPIGGTPLAELLSDSILGGWLNSYLRAGIESLTPKTAPVTFNETIDYFRNYVAEKYRSEGPEKVEKRITDLSKKIFFVSSYLPTGETSSMGVKTVLYFCKEALDQTKLNDRIIFTEDHVPKAHPEFGVQLAAVPADHLELVLSGYFSRGSREKREAFQRAILQIPYLETH